MQGHAQAQYELAAMYMSGLGVKRNPEEARRLAKLSAEQGYSAAINALEGTDPRMEMYMEKAADPNVGIPKVDICVHTDVHIPVCDNAATLQPDNAPLAVPSASKTMESMWCDMPCHAIQYTSTSRDEAGGIDVVR